MSNNNSERLAVPPTSRFNLAGILLLLLSAPLWVLVAIEVHLRSRNDERPRSYVYAVLILCVLTAAIHRLVRPRKNAWPISALVAGIGALAVLMLSAG